MLLCLMGSRWYLGLILLTCFFSLFFLHISHSIRVKIHSLYSRQKMSGTAANVPLNIILKKMLYSSQKIQCFQSLSLQFFRWKKQKDDPSGATISYKPTEETSSPFKLSNIYKMYKKIKARQFGASWSSASFTTASTQSPKPPEGPPEQACEGRCGLLQASAPCWGPERQSVRQARGQPGSRRRRCRA